MDYWIKQTLNKPAFPDLQWSRPENRMTAGKLLIIGGNLHGFAAPAEAYASAAKTGAGTVKVLLPKAVQKSVGRFIDTAEFAPSTPSGSFARTSLDTMLDLSGWADGVLLAGDLGRNSETAIVLEKFITKYNGPLTIAKDAVDYFINIDNAVHEKSAAPTLVLSLAQLQKLATKLGVSTPFTLGMDLLPLIRQLHEFTLEHQLYVIVKHHQNIIVAVRGQVSTTKLIEDKPIWRVNTAGSAAVWWLQNQQKPFEGLTSAITEVIS